VNERGEVERAKDEVRLIRDARQTGWNSPCEGEVEQPKVRFTVSLKEAVRNGDKHAPVCCGRDSDSLCADTHGEDLCGVRPRYRTHSNSKAAHEEVRANDDAFGNSVVTVDHPYP
jgi:hypothetical protein